MCGGTSIGSLVDAQMSLPYAVAVAWVHGGADLPKYAQDIRESAAVRDLLARIRVVHDPAIESNVAARLTALLHHGEKRTVQVDSPLGSADRPLADEALARKYQGLAGPVIGEERAEALHRAVFALGRGGNPAGLLQLLA